MKDITALLAGIRGETPPAEPYHWAAERRRARQEGSREESVPDVPSDSPVSDTEATST